MIGLITSFLFVRHAHAFDVDVTRVALNTSIGTQNITFSNFSEDCTVVTCAVLAIVTNATADDTIASDVVWIVGFSDGAVDTTFSTDILDDLATTDSERYNGANNFIRNRDADLIINWNAWLSSGVQIDITTAPPAAWLAHFVIFGGSGLSADVDVFTSSASLDGTVDITSPGFQPDVVFVGGIEHNTQPAGAVDAHWSFGVAVNDGSATQGSISCYDNGGVSTVNAQALTSSIYAGSITDSNGQDASIEVGSFDSQGFTATSRITAGGHPWYYMALAFGGADKAVVDIDTPTATGSDSVSIGFQSLFGMMFGTAAQAYDVSETDADGGSCLLSVFTPDKQYSIAYHNQDAATTSNTGVIVDDQIVNMILDDGTCSAGSCFEASLTSMAGNNWDLNYSIVFSDAARKWIGLAVEDPNTGAARRGVRLIQ